MSLNRKPAPYRLRDIATCSNSLSPGVLTYKGNKSTGREVVGKIKREGACKSLCLWPAHSMCSHKGGCYNCGENDTFVPPSPAQAGPVLPSKSSPRPASAVSTSLMRKLAHQQWRSRGSSRNEKQQNKTKTQNLAVFERNTCPHSASPISRCQWETSSPFWRVLLG